MIIERVGLLRQRIEKAKKLPAMARALAAESIIDELGAILELIAARLDQQAQEINTLKRRGGNVET